MTERVWTIHDGIIPVLDAYGGLSFARPEDMNREWMRAWILSRPRVLLPAMRRFPLGCRVRPLRPLMCPVFEGLVASWQESGSVSVVEPGNPTRGFCDADWLEVVDRGPVAAEWDGWLDEAEAQS